MSARVVCWFSCGVTSAVAARLALEQFGKAHEVVVAYCDTRSEHADNRRFLRDVERWLGVPIVVLASTDYQDTWDVWERTGWLVGPQGARCTAELKKRVRFAFQRAGDIQVFGFDASENVRAERFRANNPEIDLRTPLIEQGLSKVACAQQVMRAGIEIPLVYRLGFRNANCVPCVKGQSGYWNHVRKVFPAEFARMAVLERKMDVAINKSYAGDGKRKRVFLDELDPAAGRYEAEPEMECGLSCGGPAADEG